MGPSICNQRWRRHFSSIASDLFIWLVIFHTRHIFLRYPLTGRWSRKTWQVKTFWSGNRTEKCSIISGQVANFPDNLQLTTWTLLDRKANISVAKTPDARFPHQHYSFIFLFHSSSSYWCFEYWDIAHPGGYVFEGEKLWRCHPSSATAFMDSQFSVSLFRLDKRLKISRILISLYTSILRASNKATDDYTA